MYRNTIKINENWSIKRKEIYFLVIRYYRKYYYRLRILRQESTSVLSEGSICTTPLKTCSNIIYRYKTYEWNFLEYRTCFGVVLKWIETGMRLFSIYKGKYRMKFGLKWGYEAAVRGRRWFIFWGCENGISK